MTKPNQTQKQPYAAPTLTDHGSIVTETKGIYGICWEIIGSNTGDERPRPAIEDDE